MSSFSKRLLKMRKEKEEPTSMSSHKSIDEGAALAADHVDMTWVVEEREIKWPRASALHKGCIRQYVIGEALGSKKKSYLSVKDKMLFGIGNAIHFWIQNFPDVLGDKRRGWWKCLACQSVLYFGGPPKRRCPKCGAHSDAIFYKEHFLRGVGTPEDGNFYYPVTGHPDMFLEAKDSALLRVVEIKSVGGEDFDKLIAPLAEHEWQTNCYMWGCSHDPKLPVKIDPEIGYILYVCKRHRVKELPIKMFTIHKNDGMLQRIKDKIVLFREGRKHYPKKLPPPDERCMRGGVTGYMNKSCVVREQCLKFYEEEE